MFFNCSKYFLFLIFFIFTICCYADNFIANGGFEGPNGIEVVPESWAPGCGTMNTPDTQPGWWNIENEPHSGESFIDLLYKEDGTQESVFQKLEHPLPKGSCFLIEIFLAKACQDSISGLYEFNLNHPGNLVIRGSDVYGCDNGQILAVFEQVNNCLWRPFYAVFQAANDINFIYLEFEKGDSPHKDGSILIDDLSLDFTTPLPLQELTVSYGDNAQMITRIDGSNYTWTVDDIVQANDSSIFVFPVTANYNVEVSYLSTDSCLVYENWRILVEPLFPNVFTPLNQDGINDILAIKGLAEKSHLILFNRWGSVVYENTNYQNDWSPIAISSGVYYYKLHFLETDRYFIGMVTII